MATAGGVLATCGVPPLAAPNATCSPAFNSFFTGEYKAVRSAPRPHRSCFLRSRTEITHAQGVPRIFAGLFGRQVADDSSSVIVARRETVFDSFTRSSRLRISQLNWPITFA